MTRQLRDELHRIGDRAPVADVATDTWARARRARRRDGLLVLASAAAAVALVFGVVGVLPTHQAPPIATGDGGAVPSHIWSVPERMQARNNDGSWMRSQVTSDVAVGRAAAAYLTPDGLPVVIGASDGAYHLLDLPDFAGNDAFVAQGLHGNELGLELSPDGRQLAYAYARIGPDAATEPIPSGLRVLDLESGAVREVPVPGGEGTIVSTISWSPDGRWLAWSGYREASWTAFSMGGSRSIAGRVAPGATSSDPLPLGGDSPNTVAVSDVGLVAVLDPNHLVRWDGRVRGSTRIRPGYLNTSGVFDPSGASVAFGSIRSPRGGSTVDVATGEVTAHALPRDIYPDGANVRPLGWIDDRLMVLQVTPLDATGSQGGSQIVLTTREVSRTSTYRIVAHTEGGVPDNLSIAVDLMTLHRPTVDRPEPDWPWSEERLWLTIGLGVAAALVVAWGLRALRRRRPERPRL